MDIKPRQHPVLKEEVLDQGTEIRIWLMRKKIKESNLARELGIHISAISHFLNGNMTSGKVRAHLLAKGCPEELLGLDWIGAVQRAKARKKSPPQRREIVRSGKERRGEANEK